MRRKEVEEDVGCFGWSAGSVSGLDLISTLQ